jgi:polyisoprenoid-binding protein YceI
MRRGTANPAYPRNTNQTGVHMYKMKTIAAIILGGAALTAAAAPESFTIDNGHTFPSLEVMHFGTSIYRGKFNKTSGKVTLDRAGKSGSVEISIDAASIDMGNARLDEHIKSKDFLDVAQFPTATFKSSSFKFNGDKLSEIPGELTLHGVTKPVTLTMNLFNCYTNPMMKKEVCGGDASVTIKRSEYGVKYGTPGPVGDDVKLQIQVEAVHD